MANPASSNARDQLWCRLVLDKICCHHWRTNGSIATLPCSSALRPRRGQFLNIKEDLKFDSTIRVATVH
jgi:hypothetical protein